MKRNLHHASYGFIAACALSLVPQIAAAVTLPVDYTVDAKDLKKNAPAGTMVTITLHQDSACMAVVATATVDIKDIQIIESLKPVVIKGAPKPPKFARLNYVFTGVSAVLNGDLFVKVEGTGITPVGGVCQAQEPIAASGAIGPTGVIGF